MNPLYKPNYVEPKSILIVNGKGNLKQLFCPFGVIAIVQIGNIPPLTRMIVEEVGLNIDAILIYIINGKAHKYYNFHLLIQF